MGEHELGTLLGLGSERDLGTDYYARLCGPSPLAVDKEMENGEWKMENYVPHT